MRLNDLGINNIESKLYEIFEQQTRAFKMSLSFSFVLRNVTDGTYRFFYGSNNNNLFDKPSVISDRDTFDRFILKLKSADILESIRAQRPNSKWAFHLVTNLIVTLNFLDFPIGSRVHLPTYILNHPSIIALARDRNHSRPYDDNLCFFRCLALHRGCHSKNLESATKHYFHQYHQWSGTKMCNFHGIDIGEIHNLEVWLETNITIFSIDEDSCAHLISRSHRRFESTLFLNLYKNHFSYITNIKKYCKCFRCGKCDRLFRSHYKLKVHTRRCNRNVRYIFPGGAYKTPPTIFQQLEEIGVVVPDQDRHFPYFATFDFECILDKMGSESPGNTDKLEWVSIHRPISVSCCSNVPNFEEEVCFVNADQKLLVEEFVTYLNELSDAAYQNLLQRYEYVFEQLDELIDNEGHESVTPEGVQAEEYCDEPIDDEGWINYLIERNEEKESLQKSGKRAVKSESESDMDKDSDSNSESDSDSDSNSESESDNDSDGESDNDSDGKQTKNKDENCQWSSRFERIKEAFDAYLQELPVIGFNSGKYDLNAVKRSFFEILIADEESKHKFSIKKNNSYLCIKTDKLKFLDILNYLAPGFSYDQFLKAYDSPVHKSFFPYEWFDHPDKLEYPSLPPYDCFYSQLSQCNVLEKEYTQFQKLLSEGHSDANVLRMMKLSSQPKTGEENYEELQCMWREQGMETFQDFLKMYNNRDVKPFVIALERLTDFYHSKGLDPFKSAMSVPGLASRYIFSTSEDSWFALLSEKNKDLFETFKNGICGGPSIVFNRYQEKGVTKIRDGKPCQSIIGYDANALYLWAISQDMPTGPMVRRMEADDFKPKGKEPIAVLWLEWMMKQHNCHIQHQMNYGEKRIGKYKIDGWSPQKPKTLFSFYGCHFHGCQSCCLDKESFNSHLNVPMKTLYKQTLKRKRDLISMGYNIIDIWECEFKREIKTNSELKEFINSFRRPLDNVFRLTLHDIIDNVLSGSLFGAVECDIHVPPTLREKFIEMAPIFKNVQISHEDIGEHMQEFAQQHGIHDKPIKSLIGSMFGEKILLATPLLKWYLEHGLELTRVYQIVEFKPKACFQTFADEVSDARRIGDSDPSKSIIADTSKLIGNSAYGCMLKNKEKYRNIKYADDSDTGLLVNDPFFRDLNPISDNCYEVEMAKKSIRFDMPTQIGFFILQYAKLRMLEFYFDFLDKFIDRSDFQYCYMDTDSAYVAFSSDNVEDLIKPEMREEYQKVKYDFFPRDDTPEHINYDKRTPGLFKEEYRGDGIICLSSKMYYCFSNSQKDKFSCKGVNKTQNSINRQRYLDVLVSGSPSSGTNTGFRVRDNQIMTYRQDRQAFTYFYPKRKVLNDGVSTIPLDI